MGQSERAAGSGACSLANSKSDVPSGFAAGRRRGRPPSTRKKPAANSQRALVASRVRDLEGTQVDRVRGPRRGFDKLAATITVKSGEAFWPRLFDHAAVDRIELGPAECPELRLLSCLTITHCFLL